MKKFLIACLSLFITTSIFAGQIPRKSTSRIMFAASKQYESVVVPAGLLYPVWESATMTSASNPAPVKITDSGSVTVGASWWSFDRSRVGGLAGCTASPPWVTYDCGEGNSNVCLSFRYQGYVGYNVKTFALSNSMDGTTWVNILTNGAGATELNFARNVTTTNYGRYFKFVFLSSHGADPYSRIYKLEYSSSDFYSPVMTASNSPSGVISADSRLSDTWFPFYAFDSDKNSAWISGSKTSVWIKQDFGSNVVINGFCYVGIKDSGVNRVMSNYTFAASLDDTTYITQNTGTFLNTNLAQIVTNSNTTAYRYFKLSSPNGWDTAREPGTSDLVFKHYK